MKKKNKIVNRKKCNFTKKNCNVVLSNSMEKEITSSFEK